MTKELKFSSIEPGTSFICPAIGPERYTKVSSRKAVIANAYSRTLEMGCTFAVKPNTIVTAYVQG